VLIVACGTSYYSGLTARRWLETIARLPAQVEIASEYRYSDALALPNTLVVSVSQSGETADTLAALKHAQALGHIDTLAVCNVPTSAMVRQTSLRFLTRAGPEIGVASTKAFTTQLVALFMLAVTLGRLRGCVDDAQLARYATQLRRLPNALDDVLALEPQIERWAAEFARTRTRCSSGVACITRSRSKAR
jgi:glucosamine--fructose-6-phosphate aminotransferase (isomerizing)